MTLVDSHQAITTCNLAPQNDEDFGEEIVASLIAHINSVRRAQGLADLGIGSLSSTALPNMTQVEERSSSS